jgi:hypothetical protein
MFVCCCPSDQSTNHCVVQSIVTAIATVAANSHLFCLSIDFGWIEQTCDDFVKFLDDSTAFYQQLVRDLQTKYHLRLRAFIDDPLLLSDAPALSAMVGTRVLAAIDDGQQRLLLTMLLLCNCSIARYCATCKHSKLSSMLDFLG